MSKEGRDHNPEAMWNVVEACIAWQEDDGSCHFCGFQAAEDEDEGYQHDEDCPLVENGFIDREGNRK